MRKRLLSLALALVMVLALALTLSGCGKTWTCDLCGKDFTGDAYYGYDSSTTMCKDCARDYWMPLPYQNYKKD